MKSTHFLLEIGILRDIFKYIVDPVKFNMPSRDI